METAAPVVVLPLPLPPLLPAAPEEPDAEVPVERVVPLVEVFALDVTRQMKSWPEQDERSTRWFFLQEAAEAVQEPELRSIIRGLTTKGLDG